MGEKDAGRKQLPEGISGKKSERYDDIFVYVPEMGQIIRIAEGDGSNLLPEDIEEGYAGYIYYE